jgi:hypothetical protein
MNRVRIIVDPTRTVVIRTPVVGWVKRLKDYLKFYQ